MAIGRPKGGTNNKYTPEFKIQVVEDKIQNKLRYKETKKSMI